jgi:uncharacterized protein
MRVIDKHIDRISYLCKSNGVRSLFAFGSVLKDSLRPDSDIDMIVALEDQDPLTYSDHYFNLKYGLEDLFKRNIDLLEEKAINNPYLKEEIENKKVLIYAK